MWGLSDLQKTYVWKWDKQQRNWREFARLTFSRDLRSKRKNIEERSKNQTRVSKDFTEVNHNSSVEFVGL